MYLVVKILNLSTELNPHLFFGHTVCMFNCVFGSMVN